jgi:hypothetical protein
LIELIVIIVIMNPGRCSHSQVLDLTRTPQTAQQERSAGFPQKCKCFKVWKNILGNTTAVYTFGDIANDVAERMILLTQLQIPLL